MHAIKASNDPLDFVSVKCSNKHFIYSYTACHWNRVVFSADPFFFRIAECSKHSTEWHLWPIDTVCRLYKHSNTLTSRQVEQEFSNCLSYHVVNAQVCFFVDFVGPAGRWLIHSPRPMRRLPSTINHKRRTSFFTRFSVIIYKKIAIVLWM